MSTATVVENENEVTSEVTNEVANEVTNEVAIEASTTDPTATLFDVPSADDLLMDGSGSNGNEIPVGAGEGNGEGAGGNGEVNDSPEYIAALIDRALVEFDWNINEEGFICCPQGHPSEHWAGEWRSIEIAGQIVRYPNWLKRAMEMEWERPASVEAAGEVAVSEVTGEADTVDDPTDIHDESVSDGEEPTSDAGDASAAARAAVGANENGSAIINEAPHVIDFELQVTRAYEVAYRSYLNQLPAWEERHAAAKDALCAAVVRLTQAKEHVKGCKDAFEDLTEGLRFVEGDRPREPDIVEIENGLRKKLKAEADKEAAANSASEAGAVSADATSTPSPAHESAAALAESCTPSSAAASALTGDLANPNPNAWRSIPIEQLGLKAALQAKLIDSGISTIGQLEDLRASHDGLKSIKGVGQAKADAIEEAVLNWLTKNRDREVLQTARNGAASEAVEATASDVKLEIKSGITPMLQAYHDAKAAAPAGCLLLFKMGDFYESFNEDAEVISKALGLAITERGGCRMVGFPHHQLEAYLGKLIAAGHRAAVCEQVDKPPKGVKISHLSTISLSTTSPAGIAAFDPDAQSAAAIEQRAAELLAAQQAADAAGQGEELLEPQCSDDRYWNGGVEGFDRGTAIKDCPIAGPSVEQDDWLRGWLTAQVSEQAAEKEEAI